MDITPAPRLLSVLGEIELEEWQCLAEMIDNSFDAFLRLKRGGISPSPGGWRVEVDLPVDSSPTSRIVIKDNGPGMTKEQLQNSVRAGFSSKDRYSSLGLFGLGFNVATARLGAKTTVKTATTDDNFWNLVTIDFDSLVKADNYDAPEDLEQKASPSEHGTVVEVTLLHEERAKFLQLNTSLIRRKLENVYSYLLDTEGFSVVVNGEELNPRKHCVWSEERSVEVTLGGERQRVPAKIPIDFQLTSIEVCATCNTQKLQSNSAQACECGDSKFDLVDRRIHGWIGVQRYLHSSDYGIDFLRNGRKILTFDKRLFLWRDPNDPNATESIEYPTELAHQGGRIVGEIHVDHIKAVYTKDAFEFKSSDWGTMVRLIRGDAPIRPQKARAAGYQENLSPLAKIVRAYAQSAPGTKYLNIGDGERADHVLSREWGQRFHEGDMEFQDDSRWWEQAEKHDRLVANREDESEVNDDLPDIFDDIPDPPAPAPATDSDPSLDRRSIDDQIADLESTSSRDDNLSVESISMGNVSMSVQTRMISSEASREVKKFVGSARLIFGKKNVIHVYVNPQSHMFTKRGCDIGQYVAGEIASVMFQRLSDHSPDARERLIDSLYSAGFSSADLDFMEIRAEIESVFGAITEALSMDEDSQPHKAMRSLRTLDEQELRDSFAMANPNVTPDFSDPSIFSYFTPTLVIQLSIASPETLLNGRVLTRDITSEGLGEPTKRLFAWETSADLIRLGSFLRKTKPSLSEMREAQASLDRVRRSLRSFEER